MKYLGVAIGFVLANYGWASYFGKSMDWANDRSYAQLFVVFYFWVNNFFEKEKEK